jgi:hypothetical protein
MAPPSQKERVTAMALAAKQRTPVLPDRWAFSIHAGACQSSALPTDAQARLAADAGFQACH